MPGDTSMFNAFLQAPKSVADYDNIAAQQQSNQLALMLKRNEIGNLPIQNQLLQMDLAQKQLVNQRAQQQMGILGPILAKLQASQAGGTPSGTQPGQPMTAADVMAANGGFRNANPAAIGQPAPQGINGGPGPGFPFSLNDIAALKLGGMPDMLPDFKTALEGVSRAPGSEVTDVNGNRRFIPKLGEGQSIGPDGSISNIPGYERAVAGSERAKTTATEDAKSRYQLLPLDYRDASTGRSMGGSVGQYLFPGDPGPAPGAAPQPPQSPAMAGFGPNTQASVLADMRKNGVQSATIQTPAGTDQIDRQGRSQGMPAAQTKAIMDIAALRTPQEAHASIDAHLRAGDIDPQKAQMLHQNVPADPSQFPAWQVQMLQGIMQAKPGQLATQGQQAPQPGQRPALQSPDEAAAAKLRAEAPVQFQQKRFTDAHASNQKVLDGLNDTVSQEAELQNRNQQIIPLLDKFKTGGFAAEERLNFANALLNTSVPISDAAKAQLSSWVAGGDPSVGKAIQNQLAGAAIKTMLDALNKEGKPNRAIFQALQSAQEDVKSGNGTLAQVFALQKQLYDWHYEQQQKLSGAMESPDYNPLSTQREFSAVRNASLQAQPGAASNRSVPAAGGAPGQSSATPAATGFKIVGVK